MVFLRAPKLFKVTLGVLTILIFFQIFTTKSSQKSDYYLIYECTDDGSCGSLLSRIKVTLSSYTLSLLSNRNLQILDTSSCSIDNYLNSNKISWTYNPELLKNKDEKVLDELDFNQVVVGNADKKVIHIKNSQDWSLVKTSNEDKLVQSFEMFQRYFKKLFKISPNFMTKYKNAFSKVKTKNLVCVQAENEPEPPEEVKKFRIAPTNSKQYWKYLENNYPKEKYSKLLLFTENQEIIEEAKSIYQDSLINFKDLIQDVNQCQQNEDIMLKLALFESCEVVIIKDVELLKYAALTRQQPLNNLIVFRTILDNFRNGKYEFIKIRNIEHLALNEEIHSDHHH